MKFLFAYRDMRRRIKPDGTLPDRHDFTALPHRTWHGRVACYGYGVTFCHEHSTLVSTGQLRQSLQVLRTSLRGGLVAAAALSLLPDAARAFRIELKDVAPDRIERQRAEAIGQIPFPDTPNVAQFEQRLKDKGLASGAAMFIRVFKAESELEVWLQKSGRFELFATYPICHWSGTLGPKISEGDKQSPEGVYTVSQKQLHMVGRHPRSLNLGFPNVLDKQFQRTGSYILIHGGCGSVGCFAMTNPVIEEVFSLAQAALKGGQENIHVHAFPFRLTEQKLRHYALHDWYDFWRNLKDIHDAFDRTRRVPRVTVCEGRYWLNPDDEEVAAQDPLAACEAPLVASLSNPAASAPSRSVSNSHPSFSDRPARSSPAALGRSAAASLVPPVRPRQPSSLSANRMGVPAAAVTDLRIVCDRGLASCRKWVATRVAMRDQRNRVAVADPDAARRASVQRPQSIRR